MPPASSHANSAEQNDASSATANVDRHSRAYGPISTCVSVCVESWLSTEPGRCSRVIVGAAGESTGTTEFNHVRVEAAVTTQAGRRNERR
jgi:hypothetical protein